MKAQDPTRNEMLTFLAGYLEFDQFDREEAMYWFAYDWHDGQASNLYAALSTSPYKPGATCKLTNPELYDELTAHFVNYRTGAHRYE